MITPLITSFILFPFSTFEIKNYLFFLYLFLSAILSFTSSWLILWAIEKSELSKVFPLVNLTPLFMIFTGWLFLGEVPEPEAIPGIILIVIGAGFLHMEMERKNWIKSIKALFTEKGSVAMLIVSVLWSINGAVDKLGILSSSPGLWAACVKLSVAVTAGVSWLKFRRRDSGGGRILKKVKPVEAETILIPNYVILLLPALCSVVLLLASFKAYTMTKVIYVISVKRLSSIFIIILGRIILKERGFFYRISGGIIMLAGVIIIAFWG